MLLMGLFGVKLLTGSFSVFFAKSRDFSRAIKPLQCMCLATNATLKAYLACIAKIDYAIIWPCQSARVPSLHMVMPAVLPQHKVKLAAQMHCITA
jgi:hypothetical protein